MQDGTAGTAAGAAVGALLIVGLLVGAIFVKRANGSPEADAKDEADIESGDSSNAPTVEAVHVWEPATLTRERRETLDNPMYSMSASDAIYDDLATDEEHSHGAAHADDAYMLASGEEANYEFPHDYAEANYDIAQAGSSMEQADYLEPIASGMHSPTYDEATYTGATLDAPLYDEAADGETWAAVDFDPSSRSFRMKSVVRHNPLSSA